ncbi:MAG: PepSY-like domain-containing protein [Bacteroidales bacterium]|nr:PepSY-like domain-containing protein [Bacteroidales bacterium]MCF8326866.1 PepSY-like domain-containing protein [Bacteroidales bacterium]
MRQTKLFLAFIAVSLIFAACSKDENTNEDSSQQVQSVLFLNVSTGNYPGDIDTYVSNNYPNDTIEEVYQEDYSNGTTKYEVELSNDIELYFDANGNYLGMDDDDDNVAVSNLPQVIIDYVNNNHSGENIVKAEFETEDGQDIYEVYLSNGMELYFDSNGNYLGMDDDSSYINVSALPQSIKDYISNNYPNAAILYAEEDYDDGQTIYEVKLDNGMELEFDSNGNLLSSDDDNIPIAQLPQAILDYVSNNYPNNTIVEAEFEFENGQKMYEVELDNELELYFDMNGNFIKSEQDD